MDAAVMAHDYQVGGASCLSVLTDAPHFGGSVEDLQVARNACSLPVIRKDFTVDARDVCDARIMGADCVLLIAAALSAAELAEFLALSRRIDIDALVEVHDES
jgi:indole-3-glycerol phosphate synthase